MRVAPKARYDVAGSLGLRDSELGHHPQVGRSVGRFLLSVLDASLVEGEILRVAKKLRLCIGEVPAHRG